MPPTFLEDVHAIEQIYVRYCELVDAKQFDRLGDCFTSETAHDYTRALPGITLEGLAPLIASMHWNLGDGSHCGATHHNVGNFRIQVDGDRAHAKVNYYAVHRGVGRHEGALYSMWGLYDDELVRTSAGWRVARRVYSSVLTEGPVVTARDGA
ncbi:MAG: nuclear transport factor 2 family protein [Deltaproteobacteria bacterium]|nr:nuclear transport factor 2 family protein [Deltaproteobacteria bacterium]